MALDLISGRGGIELAEGDHGATEPDAGHDAARGEAAIDGLPGVGEEVESFVEAALGMGVEVGGTRGSLGASVARVGRAAVDRALGGATPPGRLVDVANDGREVAVADAGDAAAGVGAEAALSFVEVFERVAAEGADEGLARTGHRVLGVDGLEEEADGAVLGTRPIALLIDDGAQGVGVVTLEGMAEVLAAGAVDAKEDGEEEAPEMLGKLGAPERRNRIGEAVGEREERRERGLDDPEGALDGGLLGRGALALRSVFEAERVVGVAGGLGEKGFALVGDELETFAAGGGLGDDLLNEARGLVLAEREGLPETLLGSDTTDVRVLGTDRTLAPAAHRVHLGGDLGPAAEEAVSRHQAADTKVRPAVVVVGEEHGQRLLRLGQRLEVADVPELALHSRHHRLDLAPALRPVGAPERVIDQLLVEEQLERRHVAPRRERGTAIGVDALGLAVQERCTSRPAAPAHLFHYGRGGPT